MLRQSVEGFVLRFQNIESSNMNQETYLTLHLIFGRVNIYHLHKSYPEFQKPSYNHNCTTGLAHLLLEETLIAMIE
jgi:hypothetical protein